ncbi:MAG: hypothetical protein K9N23_06640 [Akkermansiaceae bacterium]|nr:hypothetical protein [Akkermansiaceae bacterium]
MKPRNMTTRILTLLNAAGCLVLCGLVVVQWLRERVADAVLDQVRTELAATTARVMEEAGRRAELERDIEGLKEAITGTQAAAETTARELGEKSSQVTALETELEAARAQVTAWAAALKARDDRIGSLTADLAATRRRLDEAITRLKDNR